MILGWAGPIGISKLYEDVAKVPMVPTMVVAFFHDTVVEWCRHRVVFLFSQEMKIHGWFMSMYGKNHYNIVK